MKKLLITGFEPFGGETINPSWEAVCRLPDRIADYSLTKICLPVVFGEAANRVIDTAEKICPDAIICVGQAGGRSAITPELVAINLRHATIADNAGNLPQDESVLTDGREAYFSTLPVRRMTEAISAASLPAQLSYSAGAYVCNDLLYSLLAHFDQTPTRVTFIHIPYMTEHGKLPSMELYDMVRGLTIAIEAITN